LFFVSYTTGLVLKVLLPNLVVQLQDLKPGNEKCFTLFIVNNKKRERERIQLKLNRKYNQRIYIYFKSKTRTTEITGHDKIHDKKALIQSDLIGSSF